MSRFKEEYGDWTEYREIGKVMEVGGYHNEYDDDFADLPYYEKMKRVYEEAFQALAAAQEKEYDYVLFTHGSSTSHRGKTTCRSQIRKAMRSPQATPFINRSTSIQHPSVFVAAIKPKS